MSSYRYSGSRRLQSQAYDWVQDPHVASWRRTVRHLLLVWRGSPCSHSRLSRLKLWSLTHLGDPHRYRCASSSECGEPVKLASTIDATERTGIQRVAVTSPQMYHSLCFGGHQVTPRSFNSWCAMGARTMAESRSSMGFSSMNDLECRDHLKSALGCCLYRTRNRGCVPTPPE